MKTKKSCIQNHQKSKQINKKHLSHLWLLPNTRKAGAALRPGRQRLLWGSQQLSSLFLKWNSKGISEGVTTETTQLLLLKNFWGLHQIFIINKIFETHAFILTDAWKYVKQWWISMITRKGFVRRIRVTGHWIHILTGLRKSSPCWKSPWKVIIIKLW